VPVTLTKCHWLFYVIFVWGLFRCWPTAPLEPARLKGEILHCHQQIINHHHFRASSNLKFWLPRGTESNWEVATAAFLFIQWIQGFQFIICSLESQTQVILFIYNLHIYSIPQFFSRYVWHLYLKWFYSHNMSIILGHHMLFCWMLFVVHAFVMSGFAWSIVISKIHHPVPHHLPVNLGSWLGVL